MIPYYLLQTLKLYCDVARHRSISQAAAQHGITQSAVSQRIGQLEKKLGVVLFDRSVRPLQLTEPGQAYLRGCMELLDRHQRLERAVSQMRQLDGHVRVEAIYSAGIDLLNDLKQRFSTTHPRVTLSVAYKRPEEVPEEVHRGRCDLGIVSYPRQWRNVAMIPLRDEPMAVICQPNHPLSLLKQVNASQLADWPMVTFEPQLPAGRQIRRYLRDHGVTPEVDHVFDNIDTIKSAVAVTDRVSILPRRTVAREVATGSLDAVELVPPLARPMGIIYARRSQAGDGFTPEVQAFVNLLLAHAGPGEDSGADLDEQPGLLPPSVSTLSRSTWNRASEGSSP